MLFEFTPLQLVFTALLFVWAGFVRSGLGFGGAALGLPFMLFIYDQPLYWLPIIGLHLLFFSGLTLRTRLRNVDWAYLRKSGVFVLPAAIAGVFGLLNLPNDWLLMFIYGVTLFYAAMWALNRSIQSHHDGVDKFLLVVGGYVAGTSLTGAPLMIAVFMRNVAIPQLRNTLFVLWFIIVAIKLGTFVALDVPLHWREALILLPVAAIGHVIGLKAHDAIMQNDALFRRILGGVLFVVCLIGLWRI